MQKHIFALVQFEVGNSEMISIRNFQINVQIIGQSP